MIKPTNKAVKRVKAKIKAKFMSNKPIRGLIKDLNPILKVGQIIIEAHTIFRKFFNREVITFTNLGGDGPERNIRLEQRNGYIVSIFSNQINVLGI